MSAIGQDGVEGTEAAEETAAGSVEETQGGETTATEEEASNPIERLLGEFGTFREDVTSRLSGLEGRLPREQAQEEEAAGDDELVLPEFSDDDFNEDGELTLQAQAREIQKMVQSGIEAAMRPERERQEQERREAEADALEERYPALQDEKVADEMVAKTIAAAKALGQPGLAREPKLLEMVYLAEEARKTAARETPAGAERESHVERGSGAGPASGSGDVPDDGDRIVALAERGRFRLK